jgi:hypothetical protein
LLREIVTETPELVEFLGPENVLRSVFGPGRRRAR